jgi:malate dehydrogenase (oxaloacetate-decarboxylating)(NADP+)
VVIAAVLGAIKIQKPDSNLLDEIRSLRVLFHGAGSANLGSASLLINEAGVPADQVKCTNSKGIIWQSADGTEGTFRNNEQKAVAQVGKPEYDSKDLVAIIQHFKPDVLIGAVGVAPGCFTQAVIEAMVAVQQAKPTGGGRPIVFALSNPTKQAEITAADCYHFSNGAAIFGSGTRFPAAKINGETREPGQVNNFFIFPGMSFGAMKCQAKTIPESFFMVAAEAVANSLDAHDIAVESVVPNPARIRTVSENVAAAVVLKAQADGLAAKPLGKDHPEIAAYLKGAMWSPPTP